MKRLLVFSLIVFSVIFSNRQTFAQADTVLPRILYTNSERTAILGKTMGWNKVDTVFTSYHSPSGAKYDIILKNLAILASTPDGKSLLIAGRFFFYNGVSTRADSGWAVARLNAPFKNNGKVLTFNGDTIGGAIILKWIISDPNINLDPLPGGKILPLGVLTGNDWFVTPSKVTCSQQWFFHGKFDGSGVVDSVVVTGSAASIPSYQNFHMSNLVTTDDARIMVCVVFDGIKKIDRAQVFTWNPSVPSGDIAFQARDISGVIETLGRYRLDSSFAFVLRNIGGTGDGFCELGLSPLGDGNISMYKIPVSGSVNELPEAGITLYRNKLPKAANGDPLHFFTGSTGEPGSPDDDHEVISPSTNPPFPLGNGGDIMFNADGSKVVFVTCSKGDLATPTESGIYIMDVSSGQVDSVINDRKKMERQPIFTADVIHKYVAPPPPPYAPGVAILDSSSLNFGVDSIGDPHGTRYFTLTDTSSAQVIVKSAQFTSKYPGIFSVTPNSFSVPLQPRTGTITFQGSFAPTAEITYYDTLTISYQDSVTSDNHGVSVLKLPITGIGMKKVVTEPGAVRSEAPTSFDLSVVPNPFTSSTQITVSAKASGISSVEIRDLLGKDIYSSKPQMLGVGGQFTYTLDANAMHLAPGAYFIIVRSGADEVTRQAIYVK